MLAPRPRILLLSFLSTSIMLAWVACPRCAVAQQPPMAGALGSLGQGPAGGPQASLALRPVYNLRPGEHPVRPALRWAYAALKHVEGIHDYECTFVKRERIEGKLTPHNYFRLKVRHRPFSVYVYVESPESERGQEGIYVEGRNDGKLLVHGVGFKGIFGTIALDPNSPRAKAGGRHPITSIGILNLTKELIVVGEKDCQYGECEVKFIHGARVNGRSCTCMQFMHPLPRREFRYHLARLFIDDELQVPTRFEGYTWPQQPGGEPVLVDECTYMNLKLNNGFTDADFDVRNPQYGYR